MLGDYSHANFGPKRKGSRFGLKLAPLYSPCIRDSNYKFRLNSSFLSEYHVSFFYYLDQSALFTIKIKFICLNLFGATGCLKSRSQTQNYWNFFWLSMWHARAMFGVSVYEKSKPYRVSWFEVVDGAPTLLATIMDDYV